eukprot:Phypoly_transcript_02545.p1 GENE.Phypoly_transcript_02545~~Phypoly_transcript_02545.p1  ORF type:complete len:888 (+),score=160.21 Phypoly_transcript_02545:83-2746(+)
MSEASSFVTPTTPRASRSWIDVQKKTFAGWANTFLRERIMKIKDFDTDLQDGVHLNNLLEIISQKKLPKFIAHPKSRFQKIENVVIGIKFIQSQGLKLVSIGAEDIADGNVKLTLGLLWTLILRYQIQNIEAEGHDETPKAALLAWCRKRLQPYGITVNDFDSSWQDGRALCALTDSLQVGCLRMDTISNDPLTDATRAINTAQDLFGIPQILDPYDLVTIPDDLSIMTYLSYFRDYVVNAEKKADEEKQREEERKRKTADPVQVYAHGSGVEREGLYANQTAMFQIQACNFYGEELKSGGEQFMVNVLGEEAGVVEAPVTDLGDGGYEVKYLPLIPDNYTIEILLNGEHIKDSPFHVAIDGATNEHTSAEGPGLTRGGSHVNKPAVFTITARDSKAQNLNHGGDKFTAQAIRQADGKSFPVTVDDNDDGTYTAVYHPVASGPHNVEILLRGKPISGAPHDVVVYAATPENSYAEGAGTKDGKAHHVASLTVFAVDVDGNKIPSGGEPFQVSLHELAIDKSGDITATIEGKIRDNGDGTYTAEYTPPGPGDYSLAISLFDQPVNGFPKNLYFKPSANGANSEVTGTGIKNGVAERPVHVSIKAKDIDGAPRTDGGDDFHVRFEHKSGENFEASVIDKGDGTYEVEQVLKKPGDYKVFVSLDSGVPVADSPYLLYIKSQPSAENSYVDGKGITSPFDNEPAVFTIHAVDDNGKPLSEGGDNFEVTLHSPSGDPLPSPVIVDNKDGTYTGTYNPENPGEYSADVRIDGISLAGFPKKVHVREGTQGEVSEFGKFAFTVVARDKRNVIKTFGGDPFEITITGTSEAISVSAIDHGDGTYTASYTVGVGRYSVSVILNGKEVVGSPFVQKVGSLKSDKSARGHTSTAKINC